MEKDTVTLHRIMKKFADNDSSTVGELRAALEVAANDDCCERPFCSSDEVMGIRDGYRLMTPRERCTSLLDAYFKSERLKGNKEAAKMVHTNLMFEFTQFPDLYSKKGRELWLNILGDFKEQHMADF